MQEKLNNPPEGESIRPAEKIFIETITRAHPETERTDLLAKPEHRRHIEECPKCQKAMKFLDDEK